MKKTILAFAMIALLGLGGQAFAEICTADAVPAATLLIPYFEVAVSEPGDGGACDDPFAATTFFSVNNASADPVIAHVTVWTNNSRPTLDFDIYLTGYDVEQLDVKDFFCSGNLPQTGSGISNVGLFSNPAPAGNRPAPPFNSLCDTSTTVGTGLPPNYNNPAIGFTETLRQKHTGQSVPAEGGDCFGAPSELAVGYITVDATQICSTLFPSDAGYWTGNVPIPADGVGSNSPNVLWGDYQYLDRINSRSEGFTAVHIEADAQFIGNGPTFYGRYTFGLAPSFLDGREPLGTTYAGRYLTNDNVGISTNFQIWREGDANTAGFNCATPPADINFSGGLFSVLPFDEDENPDVTPPSGGPSGEPTIPTTFTIPYETQSLTVGTSALPSRFPNGWYYLNLQNTTVPAGALSAGQAFLTIRTQLNGNEGLFSAGWDGTQLDGQCATAIVPVPATLQSANPSEPVAP